MLSKSLITNALALENCRFLKHFFAPVLSSSKIIGFKKNLLCVSLIVLENYWGFKTFLRQFYRPRNLCINYFLNGTAENDKVCCTAVRL